MITPSFFDLVEFLGPCVDDGLITETAAARLLIEGTDAQLTISGAACYLVNHRTARADHNERLARVNTLIAAIEADRAAVTPEEKAAAGQRLEIELVLQRAADQEKARRDARRRLRRARSDDEV
ncbi:hypothetical protein BJF79_13665 [Actinomadura sp. CNU-125]|uniref:hypothetical protein n=1 Tax=Actinomadura sp. CNU-125 TaxID=1904961 RepID=UPI00095F4ABB|nr:hypothetical protein [Actinomadura sp. CNU-125]OLT24385.1 hypothetical protein BJF79_13665 [Actinomadura sp. CNU-125]